MQDPRAAFYERISRIEKPQDRLARDPMTERLRAQARSEEAALGAFAAPMSARLYPLSVLGSVGLGAMAALLSAVASVFLLGTSLPFATPAAFALAELAAALLIGFLMCWTFGLRRTAHYIALFLGILMVMSGAQPSAGFGAGMLAAASAQGLPPFLEAFFTTAGAAIPEDLVTRAGALVGAAELPEASELRSAVNAVLPEGARLDF
jgi:hypothetical protein